MTYADANNINGIGDLFTYANSVTGDLFGGLALLSLYFIILIFLYLRGEETENCFLAAGFITAISAVLLRVASIITNDGYLFMAICAVVIPIIVILWKKR